EEEIAGVVDCLRRRWLSTGPKVQEFERAFSRLKGAPNAAAVSSGTAAIHLALLVHGVGPGDEVITTPMTFCSTAMSVVNAGATLVFADCDPRTANITAESIEQR